MSAFSSIGINFEAPGRRVEIAQYVFPRILEGNVQFFRKRRLIPKVVPFGANLTFAIAIGMISYAYNHDQNSVKKSMRWLISCIFGESDNTEGEEIQKQVEKRFLKKKSLAKNA